MPEAIADTSPLQYLHQSGLLELLPALYGQVTVPKAVAAELEAGRSRGVDLPEPEALSWASIRAPREQALLPLVTELGAGEREAPALALEQSGSVIIIDDGLARRYARLLGLRMTGTLGVLLKAKGVGLLAEVAPSIERLTALRFRLDPATRAAVLALAGESA